MARTGPAGRSRAIRRRPAVRDAVRGGALERAGLRRGRTTASSCGTVGSRTPSNACRPRTSPRPSEAERCNRYLAAELALLPRPRVMLALGAIAHRAVLRALGAKPRQLPVRARGRARVPDAPIVVDSYHCSRYNTQTRRLTARMFADVLAAARALATEDTTEHRNPTTRCARPSRASRADERAQGDTEPVAPAAPFDPKRRDQAPHAQARRLPDARRGGRGALRRQGARPAQARRELFPGRARARRRRRIAMVAHDRAHRGHGHAHRDRSAAAREQPDQAASSRATTSCCATTRAIRTSSSRRGTRSRGWRSIAARARARRSYFGPYPERGRGARDAAASCRSCSSSGAARTATSRTAAGRACSTRSAAAPRRAWLISQRGLRARPRARGRCSSKGAATW